MGLDFDPSKGKGSHKKGSIDAKIVGGTEKAVIHLTNSTYLKPYQVKKTRKGFIRAGIVHQGPAILERVRQDYPEFF